MFPSEKFQFCPQCGAGVSARGPNAPLNCAACGFHFYFNPSVAAAAIALRADGKALFIRRAKDPAKGKLAIPGGFIDIGETAEQALRREFLEEVNVEINDIEFLCSHPNDYHYRGVTYPVLDFFFSARASADSVAAALDDVDEFLWLDPASVDLDEIAFPSVRAALLAFAAKSDD